MGQGRGSPLTAEAFRERTGVSRETLARLILYAKLLRKWQGAINLVAGDSLADLWRRHMLDSAQLMAHLPPARAAPGPGGRAARVPARVPARVIVDLGSGAGFPGLVLAILGAGEVHLVESDRRKCAFLAEVARETGTTVSIHPARVRDLTAERAPGKRARTVDKASRVRDLTAEGAPAAAPKTLPLPPAQVVTARALAPLPRLLDLAVPLLAPGGVCLFLKGRRVEEELTAAAKEWKMRVERFPSLTSPSGTILRMGNISRDHDRR